MMKFLTIPLISFVALAPVLQGVTLVSADFDAGYSLGTLDGQSGTNDVNLAGSWNIPNPANDSDLQVVSGGLDYQVSGGGLISGGSQALQFTGSGTVTNLVDRQLTNGVADNTVYIRFVIQQNASPGGNDFLFWWHSFANDTGNHLDSPGMGAYSDSPGGRIDSGITATSGSFTGTPQLMVIRLTKTDNDYQTLDFWLDPAFGDSGTPDDTVTSAGQTLSTIASLGLQINNVAASTDYLMDSYAIGTSWTDVVPIPEPGTHAMLMALVVTGCFAIVRRRRRR